MLMSPTILALSGEPRFPDFDERGPRHGGPVETACRTAWVLRTSSRVPHGVSVVRPHIVVA